MDLEPFIETGPIMNLWMKQKDQSMILQSQHKVDSKDYWVFLLPNHNTMEDLIVWQKKEKMAPLIKVLFSEEVEICKAI